MKQQINPYQILDTLPQAYFLLDKDGYITFINKKAEVVTGYTIDELSGKNFSYLNANPSDEIQPAYERSMALRNGSNQSEGWRVNKDGSRIWTCNLISPLFEDDALSGFSCVMMDNTQSKHLHWQLRHNEERYRLMVQSVRDYAIFMLDKNGCIITWNEGAYRTKGYLESEIIGKHFSIFYTAPDIEDNKPERELRIAVETGKYEEEGWRIKKDGSVFWANIIITALFNANNTLVGFSKVTRDLTERKRNEEALRQSEERYRLLIEQVTDYGIFMLDDKGRIISWNEGAKRIKGYTSDEILGKYFSIFYTEEDKFADKPANELRIAVAEGKYEEEGWRLRKGGDVFWANVVITSVYNDNGKLIGFSKVTRDLTERKKAERDLNNSYQKYRNLSEVLKVANDELKYANGELEQFTSIVSHDLQEPIRTIKSFLTLIEQDITAADNKELRLYIEKALGGAERMKLLVQNLLHYTQLNRDDLEEQTIKVNELFNIAAQNVKSMADATGANIIIENSVDTISGDPVQLLQLIQNLLSNALKFTNGKSPQITLKTTTDNNCVTFSIADNGIGIAESDLNKVFEIFKRLNTSKNYPGTGIGLAICKKIVERHRGRIWTESTPGVGTTFYFTLNETKDIQKPLNEEVLNHNS